MRMIYLFIFMILISCASNLKQNYSIQKSKIIFKDEYFLSNNLDSLFKSINNLKEIIDDPKTNRYERQKEYKIISANGVHDFNDNPQSMTMPVFYETDSLQQFAPIGFSINPTQINTLVFVINNSNIVGYAQIYKKNIVRDITFKYEDLFEFFESANSYKIYFFDKNKLKLVDKILLP
ncbi:hypothetical protein JW960_27045 [candidate division KSB1 bacterium]|nr:hypothetical protein [candidate division KSB1 bacterium]